MAGKHLRGGLLKGKTIYDGRTAIYHFDPEVISLQDLNGVRKSLYTNYENQAIAALHIIRNTTSLPDSSYLGIFRYLVIDSAEWTGDTVNFLDVEYLGSFLITVTGALSLDNKGVLRVYPTDFLETKHTNGLKIVSDPLGPVTCIRPNEDIEMICYVKRATSGEHCAYYPHVSAHVLPANEKHKTHRFVLETRGMHLPPDAIMEKVLSNL